MNPAPASGLHVMVVDDDPVNLRLAARLLRELGHHGALVNGGEKALCLLAARPFDLLLLDVNMPGLGGQDVLAALRRQPPAGRRVAALMVSGHDDPGTQAHFAALGADGFLTKPLERAALAAALARLGGR
ncbi:MAG: response regulator [Roseateles sp.]|uniref:response regulator n=1 Tax=Roseateles sp. TaxID=1971397 RepID=UPI0039EBC497